MTETREPRRWLYGLTADEWLHLAAEGESSEIGPCCGNIGALREWLQTLAVCQGPGESWGYARMTLDAYAVAVEGHDTLANPKTYPLLHRVLAAIRNDRPELNGEVKSGD